MRCTKFPCSDITATSIAEFFADILLTPLEATRIRLVSDSTYASGLTTGFMRMAREGGVREFCRSCISAPETKLIYDVRCRLHPDPTEADSVGLSS